MSRYVLICAACGQPTASDNPDAVTCSPTCLDLITKSGALQQLRDVCAAFGVTVAQSAQAGALLRLTPHLGPRYCSGHLTLDQAMPEMRAAFYRAVLERSAPGGTA